MEFKSFGEIKHWSPLKMTITQKLHGCFSADTWVTLVDGTRKRIKDIVNDKSDLFVLGMNSDGEVVPSKILNYWNNGVTDDWITVKITQKGGQRGHEPRRIHTTPEHLFYVKYKGYTEASNLKKGDILVSVNKNPILTYLQEQVLIGKMLGDGSYASVSKHITFGHKISHKEYLDYTTNCLGWIAGNEQKNMISGYGTEMCRARTKSLDCIVRVFDKWTSSGKKTIPEDLCLSPIALAFWYMDDGSLAHNTTQEDRAAFATNAFSDKDLKILKRELNKYQINPVIYNQNGLRIRLNKECADKFFTLIAPYVPEIMQYKLPERFRGLSNFKIPSQKEQMNPILIEQQVISVSKQQLRTKDKNKYDLETETSNYFADSVLVHNSNGQITVFTNENGELDVRAGSRTRFIFPGPNTDNYGFAQFVQDNKAEIIEKLGEGTHYGEWVGPGINSGEGLKEKMFVLFNHNRPYPLGLPPKMALVPILYEGEPMNVQLTIDDVMEDLKVGGSVLVPGFMRTEGIVIELNGQRRKLVFEAEDTGWKGASKAKVPKVLKNELDYSYLCQPIRLEKLLSRDEVYIMEYPKSLGSIVKDYVADLEKEGQLPTDPDECKAVKKNAAGQIFSFIKTIMKDVQV